MRKIINILVLILAIGVIGYFQYPFQETKDLKIYQTGQASYYNDKFHGKKTASGDVYNKNALTAAHKSLPFKTKVLVKNKANDKEVLVVINDRGPHVKSRIIDLSYAAAKKIEMLKEGTTEVEIYLIEP